MSPELESFTGKKLGDYLIGKVIGRGGMAVVFRGEHCGTGETVAIKIIRPGISAEPEFRKRIAREARLASKLTHPNIVRVRSIHNRKGYVYMVMDYIEGTALFAIEREKGPIALSRAEPVMRGILEALKFAHEHKVVHRDIKPENVLVIPDGKPLLTDFGIAKQLEGTKLTKTGLALGTPLYMSPEQVRGERDIDIRTDIYSVGILFYELLCGKVPFDGDDPVSIGYKHVHSPPVIPSDFNRKMTREQDLFVLKAIEKERIDRYQNAGEMLAALDRLLAGSSLDIRLNMPVRRLQAKPGMGPLGKALTVTGLVAALLIGGLYYRDGDFSALMAAFGEETVQVDVVSEARAMLRSGDTARACEFLLVQSRKGKIPEERAHELAAELFRIGKELQRKGDSNGAGGLLTLAYQFDSSDPGICSSIAEMYLSQKKWRLAASYFGQTMKLLEPEQAFRFASQREKTDFSKLPKEELERIGEDMCEVGRRLYRHGKSDMAREILRKSLHYKENQLQAHRVLSEIYREKGDLKALAYHQKRYAELFKKGGE